MAEYLSDSAPQVIREQQVRQISIRYVNGYWTIFSGPQPIISCASYERAVELVSL